MFDAAELGVSVGDHRGNPGRIHHVGRDAQRLPAALANALANLCVTLRQDVGNDKIGAKVREPERASTPYSDAAARDESNLARQSVPGLAHEGGRPVSGETAASRPKP